MRTTFRSTVSAGWIQVGGILASLFSFYYFGAALDDSAGRKPIFFYKVRKDICGGVGCCSADRQLIVGTPLWPAGNITYLPVQLSYAMQLSPSGEILV